jgi:hypothetical protein
MLQANNVTADTPVNVTVQDLGPLTPVAPSQTVAVTVRAAPLLNSFTITPNLTDCGTALCFGPDGYGVGDRAGARRRRARRPRDPLRRDRLVLCDRH